MISLRKTAIAAALALTTVAGPAFAQVDKPGDIKFPPLRKVQLPQPKRVLLGNGMVIFLQEHRELPLIRGTATIRGGERDVPADKAGLASILDESWRTGGTKTKSGDQLDEFLEARAARVETGADDDSMSVSMDVLKDDFDTVLPIWIELLRAPEFRQEKIDLAKTQMNTMIARRNDDPSGIVSREAARLGYGENSPYGRVEEYSTVASVTRGDLLAFHKRFVHPNNIILAFVGDFDSAKLEAKLRQAFSSWPKGPQAPKPDLAIAPAAPGVYFVAKDDVTQANIAMVHPGTVRNNPDYPALVVMNEVFSGGFSGRLMQKLRSQRGLTYGVSGGVGAPWDHPGLFRVSMSTKSGSALESIQALKDEIATLVTSPVTPAELGLAKESILNAYVFTMDSRAKALSQQVLLEFYGFPADYFVKYPSEIEKVTAADVQRVAQKYVKPDQLAILVVGKEKDFEKPLSSLGKVTPIDITIPEPGAKKAAAGAGPAAPAVTASTPAAQTLMQKVQDFVGGKAKLEAIQSLRRIGSMAMVTPQGPMNAELNALVAYPSSQRIEMTLPMGLIVQVFSPDASFVITPMGTQDIPSSQRDAAMGEMKAEMVTVLRNLANPKYLFNVTGTEKVGDVETQVVQISADGSSTRWYVDASNGRVLRSVSTSRGAESATDYTRWQTFDGINLPVESTMTRGGEKAGEVKLTTIEINPKVEANAFAKPEAK
ncbi:MAG: pitrilysin family protein [Thermoanaerobaculia bacterium]